MADYTPDPESQCFCLFLTRQDGTEEKREVAEKDREGEERRGEWKGGEKQKAIRRCFLLLILIRKERAASGGAGCYSRLPREFYLTAEYLFCCEYFVYQAACSAQGDTVAKEGWLCSHRGCVSVSEGEGMHVAKEYVS